MQFRIKNTLIVKMYVNNVHAISKRVQFALQSAKVHRCSAKLWLSNGETWYCHQPVISILCNGPCPHFFLEFSVKSNLWQPQIFYTPKFMKHKQRRRRLRKYFNWPIVNGFQEVRRLHTFGRDRSRRQAEIMLDLFQFWSCLQTVEVKIYVEILDGSSRWTRQKQNSRLTSRSLVVCKAEQKQEADWSCVASTVGSAASHPPTRQPANPLSCLIVKYSIATASPPVFALSFSFPTLGLEVPLPYNCCCDRYEVALARTPTHKLLTST